MPKMILMLAKFFILNKVGRKIIVSALRAGVRRRL